MERVLGQLVMIATAQSAIGSAPALTKPARYVEGYVTVFLVVICSSSVFLRR